MSVLLLTFSIPGLSGPFPGIGCGAALSDDKPRDLNGEVYGDWAFELDQDGRQASGADATATISFIDQAGTMSTLTMKGPVVRGTLPKTYSGGQNGGACFHGYGSSGISLHPAHL